MLKIASGMAKSINVKDRKTNVIVREEKCSFLGVARSDWTDDNVIRAFLAADVSFHIKMTLLPTSKRKGNSVKNSISTQDQFCDKNLL